MNVNENKPEPGMIFKDRSKLPSATFLVTDIVVGKVRKDLRAVTGYEVTGDARAPAQRTYTPDMFQKKFPLVMWRP